MIDRPDRPVSRSEELALAETRDLPPRADVVDQRDPIAALRPPTAARRAAALFDVLGEDDDR